MKILIVEDSAKEMARAVEVATSLGIEVVKSIDAKGANAYFGEVDGVITDIYMPLNADQDRHNQWNHDQCPCGLLVAFRAQKANIPFILCTGGYHHGSKFEWINQLRGVVGWEESMVDGSNDYHEENATKPWDRAFAKIKEMIERKAKV